MGGASAAGDVLVTRDDVVEALQDAESIMWRAGGTLTVFPVRVRATDVLADGMEGEAFTTAVVLDWQDARPRPEREHTVEFAPPVAPEAVEQPQPEIEPEVVEEFEPAAPEVEKVPEHVLVDPGGVGDGLIVTELEDNSAILR